MPTRVRDTAPSLISQKWSRRRVVRALLAVPIGLAVGTSAPANAAPNVGPASGLGAQGARSVGPGLIVGEVRTTRSRSAQVISVETVVGDQTPSGRFSEPRGLAQGPDATIYVVEGGNHRLQRLTLDGASLALLGGPGDGPGRLDDPTAVAVDADGTLLVTDTGHGRVVRLAPDGAEIGSWTASGGSSGKLVEPYGVTVAQDGSIYVSDPESRRVERYGRDGAPSGGWTTEEPSVSLAMAGDGTIWSAERDAIRGVKTTFRGRIRQYSPTGDTLTTLTTVTWPEMLTVAPNGSLIVTDNGHFLDNPFAARRFSPSGEEVGRYGGQGPGRPPGGFGWAHGIVALPDGRVVVADSTYNCLQVFAPDGAAIGVWGTPRLVPVAMHPAPSGALTVVSGNDPRVHRVAPDGTSTVIATPTDYRPTRLPGPSRVAFAPDGRAYIVQANTGELKRHAADGTLEAEIRLAANGVSSGSPIAGLAVDAGGRFFVSQAVSGRLQRLSPDGQLEVEWTATGGNGRPDALAVGPSGLLYVVDPFNHRVDRYSPDGEHLATVVGPEVEGRTPLFGSVAVGADDRLLVTDVAEERLILVGADGATITVSAASMGLEGKTTLGAVAFDPSGSVLVALKEDARVLRVTLA